MANYREVSSPPSIWLSVLVTLFLATSCTEDSGPGQSDAAPPDHGPAPDMKSPDTLAPDAPRPDLTLPPDLKPPPDRMQWWLDVGIWPDVGTPSDFPHVMYTEKVTCHFVGSSSMQQCYAATGAGCSGISTCTTKVSGGVGTVLWKSTCGGSGSTVMDGKNEAVTFSCP